MAEALGYQTLGLGWTAALARLLVAAALGMALGAERERKDRPAGLRTYTLTSVAACLFTIITGALAEDLTRDDQVVADPIRIVDAVTAGVAFLAAGTIISQGGRVIGLTTGAGMWMAGAIGVASGAGYYVPAALTCALTLAVLTGMRLAERGKSPDD